MLNSTAFMMSLDLQTNIFQELTFMLSLGLLLWKLELAFIQGEYIIEGHLNNRLQGCMVLTQILLLAINLSTNNGLQTALLVIFLN